MSLSDICTTFVSSTKLKDDSDKNIIEFAKAPWGLGMGTMEGVPPLYPVQEFILKCYYNIPLDGEDHKIIINDRFNEKERFRFTELEYLKFLNDEGRINIKEVTGAVEDNRLDLELIIGRRGTKTSTISVITSFETYKLLKKHFPQEYYRIMPDDEIRITCIATNQEQAGELFRRITGHLERAEYFKKFRNKPTLGYMQLSSQRDIEMYGSGMRPSLRLVAAACSGRGIRGHNNIVAIMDEMAYFFEAENSADRSDKAVYDAVAPSVAKFSAPDGEPHGRIIAISSPAMRTGQFYDLYQRSLEPDCKNLLMIKAPTWEVDYTLSPKFLRAKFSDNPITYMSEYGAEFSDRISAWIDNEQVLRINIIPGLRTKTSSYERTPHFLGIDIGLKNDGTALAICHTVKMEFQGQMKEFIELDCLDVRYPGEEDKEYFRPEEMVEWISTYMDKFFIVKGVVDQYAALSVVPLLHDKGFKQIEELTSTRDMNSRVYQNLMSKMLDAALRIPESEETEGGKHKDIPLIKELLTLQAKVHSKYLISVQAPQVKGAHDDCSDAFVRAVWLASEYLSKGGRAQGSTTTEGVGAGLSFRRYAQKQRISSGYTNRPSSSLQMQLAGSRSMSSSLDRISTTLGGKSRR